MLRTERAELVEQLTQRNWSGLAGRERAMATYARRLTQSPATVGLEHAAELRVAGLDDREIHDLAMVVAYFAFANRVALGLGAEVESTQQLGQWPSDSDDAA